MSTMETAREQSRQPAKPSNVNDVKQIEAKAGKNQSSANKVSDERAKKKKKSNGQSRQSKQNQQQQQQQQQNPANIQNGRNEGPGKGFPPSISQDASLKKHGKSSPLATQANNNNICANLNEFSERAKELKDDINKALERQENLQIIDQPLEVAQLRDTILELSSSTRVVEVQEKSNDSERLQSTDEPRLADQKQSSPSEQANSNNSTVCKSEAIESHQCDQPVGRATNDLEREPIYPNKSSLNAQNESDSSWLEEQPNLDCPKALTNTSCEVSTNKNSPNMMKRSIEKPSKDVDVLSNEFEPLTAKLDADTKYAALSASLQRHFNGAPHLLEPICRKLIHLSDQNEQLSSECLQYKSENQKLLLIKEKLENLSRELQKANNLIRIESLDLIKAEQGKAKEQTAKIQSTLSGVIKLFDENQQRNMNLRQENLELQSRLKSLLEHCDNWEKSVEAALKQRDIENRLIKTELAKSNLIKNEEREKFLVEKKELLRVLSMMQEQQHRIEGQEAKLRSDLSNYATKYDECQSVISKGMSKFQAESKRMLKQLETSRHDYVSLLSKYEATTKKVAQLMGEKQNWTESMSVANKKIETLEKLCRALKADINNNKNNSSSCLQSDSGVDCRANDQKSGSGTTNNNSNHNEKEKTSNSNKKPTA